MNPRRTVARNRALVSLFVPALVAACYTAPYTAQGSDSTIGGTTPSEIQPLRRLSKAEYGNAVYGIVDGFLPAADATAARNALAPVLARVPNDTPIAADGATHGGYESLDQAVDQTLVNAQYTVALAAAKELTGTPARLTAFAGTCATDADVTNDATCIDGLVRRLGERALRRPLTAEDIAFYSAIPKGKVTGPDLADLVTVLLMAPRFVYAVESGSDPAALDAPLDVWELASRLSFFLWREPPDEALRGAAASGALLTEAGYAAQVERLFADARSRRSLDAFSTGWLWLANIPALDARNGTAVYDTFAGGDAPGPEFRGHVIQETLDAVAENVARGGTLSDLLRDRRSYATTPDVAKLYGVPVRAAGAEAPVIPDPARVGLLTRLAFLVSASANTRPIMKGVFVRRGLLCDPIPLPPAAAMMTKVELKPDATTRQVVEQLTEQKDSVCVNCHQMLINPLGFTTEAFDALGRTRAFQTLFDEHGVKVGQRPILTSGTPRIDEEDLRTTQNVSDVSELIASSGKLETCFARQYFRFAWGRKEGASDSPLLSDLAALAKSGKPLGSVLKQLVLRPEFRRRTFATAQGAR